MKKRITILLVTLALLKGGALAEAPTDLFGATPGTNDFAAVATVSPDAPAPGSNAAVDAFNALLAESSTAAPARAFDSWLDDIMAGKYAAAPADIAAAEALAADLEALSSITGGNLAAYASARGLKVAQVRNAYYKALANVLSAEIMARPASEQKYRNIQTILSLFLTPEAEADSQTAASKAEIRAIMTPERSRSISEQSGLPAGFVEFVIMDEDWDDDDWENDENWRTSAGWSAADAADALTIGSRDTADSTRIADMQERLISLGYLRGKADGIFGPRTQSALLEFQLANGMPANGVYNDQAGDRLSNQDAVARWDYDDDFWDSKDYDRYRSPDTTGTRNTPNTPNTPGDNDTPRQARASQSSGTRRDTRNTPDTPKRSSSSRTRRDTPNTPDTPNG